MNMKKVIVPLFFALAGAALFGQKIDVTSPQGGENWRYNSTTHEITWTYSNIADTAKVRLLLFRNGTRLGVIADNVPIGSSNKGKYTGWPVGAYDNTMADPGGGFIYKVRIRRVSNAEPYGESPGGFSIFNFPHQMAYMKAIAITAKHSSGYVTIPFNYVADLDEGKAYYSMNASNGTCDMWWSKNSVPPHQYMLIPDANAWCMMLYVPFAEATKSFLQGHANNMTHNPIVSPVAPINMVVGFKTNLGRLGAFQVMNVGATNDQLALKWVTYEN
jgi:hypothetical protein